MRCPFPAFLNRRFFGIFYTGKTLKERVRFQKKCIHKSFRRGPPRLKDLNYNKDIRDIFGSCVDDFRMAHPARPGCAILKNKICILL